MSFICGKLQFYDIYNQQEPIFKLYTPLPPRTCSTKFPQNTFMELNCYVTKVTRKRTAKKGYA